MSRRKLKVIQPDTRKIFDENFLEIIEQNEYMGQEMSWGIYTYIYNTNYVAYFKGAYIGTWKIKKTALKECKEYVLNKC